MSESKGKRKKYYKVLVDGKSCHGGDLQWSLPVGKKPGKWHEVDGQLQMCSRGIHVTSIPSRWGMSGCKVYAVEIDGEFIEDGGDKICCRKVRLTREITDHVELAGLRMVFDGMKIKKIETGEWSICGGNVKSVYGNATVKSVCGNATVESVYGNATVESVHGNATVESVYDNATVKYVYGNATVKSVYGNATVESVYGNATMKAKGDSTITIYGGTPTCDLSENAVLIDRRGAKPVVILAKENQ